MIREKEGHVRQQRDLVADGAEVSSGQREVDSVIVGRTVPQAAARLPRVDRRHDPSLFANRQHAEERVGPFAAEFARMSPSNAVFIGLVPSDRAPAATSR